MTTQPTSPATPETPTAPAGYALDSDGIARPIASDVGEITVTPPTHGTDWRPTRPQPLVAILGNDELPEVVRPLADEWRTLSRRVDEAESDLSAAIAAVSAAPDKDSAARREAAVKGAKKLPSATAHQHAAAQTHADAVVRLDAFRGELARVGSALLADLRAHREELVAMIRPRIEQAVTDYRAALDTADSATAAASSALASATAALGLLDDLDSGHPFDISAASMDIHRPDFAPARVSVNEVEKRVADIDTRREPAVVQVESLTNGHRWHAPTATARQLAASGSLRILSPLAPVAVRSTDDVPRPTRSSGTRLGEYFIAD